MKRRFDIRRLALVAAAAGLLFTLAGDRTRAQAVSVGIDPLEVLNLQIKPNVLIAFDSSGSMNDNLDDTQAFGGDYQYSKMGGGKRVLRTVIPNNADKITFLFGQYRQEGTGSRFNNGGGVTGSGTNRFSYWVRSDDCGGACPTVNLNTIYAFQTISDAADTNPVNDNQLYFSENGGPNCTVAIAPGFYASGNALAAAMQTAMLSCPGRSNNYTVSYGGNAFTFTRTTGTPLRTFNMLWGTAANSVRTVLNAGTTNTGNGTSWTTGNATTNRMALSRGTNKTETINAIAYTHQELIAGRFWNGQTIYALTGGTICGQAAAVAPVTPPVVYVQQVASCGGASVGPPVPFQFAGGYRGGWTGASNTCNGFKVRVNLNACDQDPAPQVAAVTTPYLQDQWEYDQAAGPTLGNLKRYLESTDGLGTMVTAPGPVGPANIPTYGMPANGSTPIANSLADMKGIFTFLWAGAPAPATPPGPVVLPPSGAISGHTAPREKTIVLFITDGDDTCSGSGDPAALAAAVQAANLYRPLVGGLNPVGDGTFTAVTDPASSVTTYLVGFGLGASVNRLNWIAWGGSGMQPAANWGSPPTAADRAKCVTCIDAFIAPDAASLASILQSIFDQGAQSGEFTAQQSLIAVPYEYVDLAGGFRADQQSRYSGITPTRYLSSFSLPGFNGKLQAIQSQAVPVRWEAGSLLRQSVGNGMLSPTNCPITGNAPAVTGNCLFTQLHGNASDVTISTAAAAIKRRIYTTPQNGAFAVTVNDLKNGVAPVRTTLWPPPAAVAPNSDSTQGSLDLVVGLPSNGHPDPANAFLDLQRDFKACLGAPLPGACTSGSAVTRMQRGRREVREMILAFMAGAQPRLDNNANPLRVSGGSNQSQIIYEARAWVLADSTLATPAVLGPPLDSEPSATPYTTEYRFFRDGVPTGQTKQGVGLRNPEKGGMAGNQPVMTVVYAPANDMLHAFRAGPNVAPSSSCNPLVNECGGQELWGFVPFDRLGTYCQIVAATQRCNTSGTPAASVLNYGTLGSRFINKTQKRTPHDYMLARGVRAFDVFARGSITVGGQNLQGLWRRVILFGRGAGGRSLTALDVTAPGDFKDKALTTTGPIPLWNRGNPDTADGTTAGARNGSAAEYNAYLKMGQTWSLPAVGFVDKTKNGTARNPVPPGGPGVEFVGYMGSGYGQAGEGTMFYTFDVLTGDIIASVDVETAASTFGIGPRALPYTNALVANAAAYNPSRFSTTTGQAPNSAFTQTTRVYLGDLHGRLWKFLTAAPGVAVPMADLGQDQPVATAAALLGYDAQGNPAIKPHVYITSGNDSRAGGPFRVFGFRDDNPDDLDTTVGSAASVGTSPDVVQVFPPAIVVTDPATSTPFIRTFDQGPVVNAVAPTPYPLFRGTVQPATALTSDNPPKATAFFAGTRFNPPLTAFAPKPPPYPCRSSFDTIIYVLDGATGGAAYDLNVSGDDAYAIFQNSRTVAIKMTSDPANVATGSKFEKDEGLIGATPEPPPAPGLPPGAADVRIVPQAGRPLPALRMGSTVCQ